MLGVQNCKIKAFPANANIYSFCKFKPKYELEKTSKFKFNKGTIDTHSTIADRQHRVFLTFLTFLTFLLSVVLALLTLSHNTCHFGSSQLLIQAFCEKTVLEVLTHMFVLLKQYTGIEVNWLITISNKIKANIQITTSCSKLHANKNISHYSNKFHSSAHYLDGIR